MQEYLIVLSDGYSPHELGSLMALLSEGLPEGVPKPVHSGNEIRFRAKELDNEIERSIYKRPCVERFDTVD